MKYQTLIERLDEDRLYTPSAIARFAEEQGMISGQNEAALRLAKQRIRIGMGRFSNNHGFPDQGDGILTLAGQKPTPAWYGWRWITALTDVSG